MTNRENYKKAFDSLHASRQLTMEDLEMKSENMRKVGKTTRPLAVAAACAVLICGTLGTAYAADIGGFRQMVNVWLHGKPVSVTIIPEESGGYTFTYPEDGENRTVGGGGVAIDADGKETALSAEEVLESMAVSVEEQEDGSVWLYDHALAFEITDYRKEGKRLFCYRGEDGRMRYCEVEEDNNGFSCATEPTEGRSQEDYILLTGKAR